VSHTYTKAGSYRVVLSVKPGPYTLVAAFAQVTVGGGTPPVLSLSATPTSGKHPLAVTFTLGTNIPGNIASWQLQFGDGQRTGKPPATVSHTYTKAGTYGALLIVASTAVRRRAIHRAARRTRHHRPIARMACPMLDDEPA
jgi:PKD repeat protein